jgi:hypothetical protein
MRRAVSIRWRKCFAEDCSTNCRNEWGYCREHFATAHQCKFDGCLGRVRANTTTDLCREHRWMHRKLRGLEE